MPKICASAAAHHHCKHSVDNFPNCHAEYSMFLKCEFHDMKQLTEDDLPRKPKGQDYRDDVKDMDDVFLVDLAFQLYARAMHPSCSQKLHERAFELKDEVTRRLVTRGYPKAVVTEEAT